MLGDRNAIATVAVKDIEVARQFYEVTLGLEVTGSEEPGVITYKTGNTALLVYQSQYARTNRATSVTWGVPDIEGAVRELKAKGIAFEWYDMPGITREGDIHGTGTTRTAWFKDPDNNIHALVAT